MANGRPAVRTNENLAWETRSLALGTQPNLAAAVEGVALDARRIYLTHYQFNPTQPTAGIGGKLVVLDADTLATLKELPVGGMPRDVAVGPSRIYVVGTDDPAGQPASGMKLFTTTNFAPVLPTAQFLGQPKRVAHSASRSRVYVTAGFSDLLHVRNDLTGAPIATVNVGVGALGVAVDDNRVYVTRSNPSPVQQQNALVVVNADTNTVINAVPIPPIQSMPQDVAVLPALKRIFVAHLGIGGGSQAPRVTVLNRDDLTKIAEIPLPGTPSHLAVDATRNKVYATTSAGLVVIDGALNTVQTVLAPERPTLGVAASPRGQVVFGDPTGGRASVAERTGAGASDVTLLRPDDLLHLDFEFHNLKLVTDGGSPRLTREVAAQPAFLVVGFAPQSVAEQSSPVGSVVSAPVPAVLAGRSRLVFRVPDNVAEIPYTAAGLLDWDRLQPALHPAALAPGSAVPNPPPTNTQPLPTHTAIELPYRLLLSPDKTATWEHTTTRPGENGDRSELWHTRLRGENGSDPEVRAVWTPDLQQGPPHGTNLPLTFGDRRDIARLSADWTLASGANPYTPEPVETDELMLSALGGFLRARGAWDAPEQTGLDLELWRQTTTLGRDHKVMAVRRGRLFPWGHRAVKVKVVEREITTTPDGPLAALRQREFIIVTQPEVKYSDQPYQHGGREMPFASGVRVLTTTTPDLKTPTPNGDIVATDGIEPAIWVRAANNALYDFGVSATDPTGRKATWSAPLIWSPEKLMNSTPHKNLMVDAYTAATTRRTMEVSGQQVALAAPSNGAAARAAGEGDISLTTEELVFGLQKRTLPDGTLSVLPRLESARVRIPAVEQMLGVGEALNVELYEEYLNHGLQSAKNAAAVYAKLAVAGLPKLDLPAEKAGGLAAAAFDVQGISERLGPVVGNLGELAQGRFDPENLLALADAKLLGTVSLMDLILKVTEADKFEKQLPSLGTEIERDGSGVPVAVTNRLRWEPRIQDVGPFKANIGEDDATLTIDTFFRQEVAGGEPDYTVTGKLTNFHIDFLGVLAVNFRKLEFVSAKGKKADVDPVLDGEKPITFNGPLEYLDRLREKIPFDGFSDPPALEVSERGVDVSYSLGLPPLSFGAFNLQNVTLGAGLFLPFKDEAAGMRFNFSQRHNPFQLTVLALGGGGFFALEVALNRIVLIEASLEFGAGVAVNLGVARGSLYVMGGIYFALRPGLEEDKPEVELTGYLRAGGELSVLGLISVSTEFYMALTYLSETNELRGQATVKTKVRFAFLSKTVSITLERRFAGPPRGGDASLARGAAFAALDKAPSFGDGMTADDWQAYAGAFA